MNNIITTPVTLQLRPSKGSTNINVLKAHQKIFSAMTLVDPTLKSLLFKTNKLTPRINFNPPNQSTLPRSKIFIKNTKSSIVYISHKIESAIPLGDIKYGNKQQLSNIFDTLVTNNSYLSLNKFYTHKEHFIRLFTHINPKVTLRDNFRNEIQDE